MNYKNIYENIINRAKDRLLDCYVESHHIIPRCIGGDNSASNLVNLTAEEHYVAHQLLVKIYPQEYGLIKAAVMMSVNTGGNRPNNKLYSWLRRKHSESTSGENNVNFGRPRTDEVKKKISLANTGKGGSKLKGRIKGPLSDITKEKLSNALKGRPNINQQGDKNVMNRPEVAKKVADANRTRVHSPCTEETKLKIGLANKGHKGLTGNDNPGTWQVSCLYCQKEVTVPSLTRWHKDCKLTQTNKDFYDI